MTNPLVKKSWSPYVVGSLIGVLSWFAFATADQPLGITTAFEHTAALAEKAALPAVEQTNGYFAAKQAEGKPPKIGWEWMLVVGVFFGSLASARFSGDVNKIVVPPLWAKRFGASAGATSGGGFLQRCADDVWSSPGARLHQRTWHQRHATACGFELALHFGGIRGCHRNGAAGLRPGGHSPCLIRQKSSLWAL